MGKKHQMYFILFIFVFLNILLMAGNVGAQPAVELEIDPKIPNNIISLGSGPGEITITTRTDTQGLKFGWSLDGPGRLDGDTAAPGIFYILPQKIDGKAAQATITVTIADGEENKTTKRVTFTLMAPEPTPVPTPSPTPGPTPTPIPIRIRQVILKDSQDTIMNPTYEIKPGETLSIIVEVTKPEELNVGVECTAIRGSVDPHGQGGLYTAPNKADTRDILTIKAIDHDTGKTIVHQVIKIKIVDTQ